MGYSTRNGGLITDYWPDDDENTIYISEASYPTLDEIISKAREKWGQEVDFTNIVIRGEKIHTSCITYDLYDPSDYTNFVVIEWKNW